MPDETIEVQNVPTPDAGQYTPPVPTDKVTGEYTPPVATVSPSDVAALKDAHADNATKIAGLADRVTAMEQAAVDALPQAEAWWNEHGAALVQINNFALDLAKHGHTPATVLWEVAKKMLGLDVPVPSPVLPVTPTV